MSSGKEGVKKVTVRRIPAAAKGVPEPLRQVLLDFPRQALHARTLGFRHPRTGQDLRFESEPPEDFQGLMESLSTFVG